MDNPQRDKNFPSSWLLCPENLGQLRDFAFGMIPGNLNPDAAREYQAVGDALDRLHAIHARTRASLPTSTGEPVCD